MGQDKDRLGGGGGGAGQGQREKTPSDAKAINHNQQTNGHSVPKEWLSFGKNTPQFYF